MEEEATSIPLLVKGKQPVLASQKEKNEAQPASLLSLFRFGTKRDLWTTAGGITLCFISAPFLPIILVAYGEFINMIVDRQHPKNSSSTEVHLLEYFGGGVILENATREVRMEALMDDAWAHAFIYASTNLTLLASLAFGIALVKFSAARQSQTIRQKVFESVLRHDMTWFDINGGRSFATKINEELTKLEEGIGSSLGIFVHFMGNVVFGFGTSLYLSWKLSIVVGSILPVNIALCIIIPKLQNSLAMKETEHSEKAGSIVSEALTYIRTVVAYGGEDKEVNKYSAELKASSKYAIRRALITGLSTGATWVLNLLSMSLSFIYGTRLLSNEEPIYNIISVMALVWICAMRFSFAFRLLDNFLSAKAAGASIFKTVDASHGIDPFNESGIDLSGMVGKIELKDVSFSYASRPEATVLDKVNISVNQGERIAIVGPSGSGKTTVLQLMQRFYDCDAGEILINDSNLEKLNIKSWREQIGSVGQEAALFSGTISENIRFGCLSASQTDVINAAKMANAHNFIKKLDRGYNTVLGAKGGTLSGGEKQRIVLARALVRRPNILLLDEPTSALDAESRDIVEAALQEASKGRMTILVTHRLANLQNTDRIYVVDCGKVAEEGSYEHLISNNGLFCKLLQIEEENTTKTSAAIPVRRESLNTNFEERYVFGSRLSNFVSSTSIARLDHGAQNDEKLFPLQEIGGKNSQESFFKALLKWNRPELPLIGFGFFMAICTGICLPLFNVVYGELAGSFQESTIGSIQEAADKSTLHLVAILSVMFITMCSTIMAFAIAGERITHRIRITSFTSILHQKIGWFDDSRNHVGALCLRLADDAKAINDVTGPGIAMMVQATVNLVVGVLLSFYFSWELTLASLPTIPLLFMGPFFEGYLNHKDETKGDLPLEDASRIAIEAVENKVVVTSLGLEKYFMEKYSEALEKTVTHWRKAAIVRGLAIGFGNVIPHLGYTVSLGYGCYLIGRDDMPYEDVIKVGELIVLGGILLAAEFVFSPVGATAKVALARLQAILEANSAISSGGVQVLPAEITGPKIQYSKVTLSYPTRPDTLVLDNIDFSIMDGQHIGVVGPSGSGKSSIILLLQRLYDQTNGTIYLNSLDIQNLALHTLRSHMGQVSQEPVLFSGTIRENISYGDNTREVNLSEIIEAAKSANIHTFISNLPAGYETELGAITQLSGGQKQRIAIARALVRNPKVLLLDEATSALDPESEKVVQEALNKATESRTTITVAHRLGAVAHANVILTIEGGRLVETRIFNKGDQ